MSNNYIVKHYKRIVSSKICDYSGFDFLTFGAFDGIKIIKSPKFSELHECSLAEECADTNEGYNRIISCERQKTFLYSLDDLSDNTMAYTNRPNAGDELFLCANNKTDEPIIVISTVGFFSYEKNDYRPISDIEAAEKTHAIIQAYENQCRQSSFLYKIFGTLIPNSVVVVFRSTAYAPILKCLEFMDHYTTDETVPSIGVSDIYSVYGISQMNAHKWREAAHIRLQTVVTSDFDAKNYLEMIHNSNCMELLPIYKAGSIPDVNDSIKSCLRPTFGEYDYEIEAVITDTGKFVEFATARLPRYGQIEHFKIMLCAESEYPNALKGSVPRNIPAVKRSSEECQNYLNKLKKCYFEIHRNSIISLSVSDMLCRLIVRISQTLESVNTRDIILVYIRKISDFLDRIISILHSEKSKDRMHSLKPQDLNAIITWVKYVNTILDNNIIDYYVDFEKPQREPSFLGTASVVLLAYQKYVDKLMQMFDIHEDISITVDISSEIKMTELLNKASGNKQFFIKIPCAIVYSAKEVLLFLTHEIMHRFIDNKNDIIAEQTYAASNKQSIFFSWGAIVNKKAISESKLFNNVEGSFSKDSDFSSHNAVLFNEIRNIFGKKADKDINEYICTEALVDILTLKFLSGTFNDKSPYCFDASIVIDEYLYCCVKSLQYRQGNVNGIDIIRYYYVYRYCSPNNDVSLMHFLNHFKILTEKYDIGYGILSVNDVIDDERTEQSFASFKIMADSYIVLNTEFGQAVANNRIFKDSQEYQSFVLAYNSKTGSPFDTDLNLVRSLYYELEPDYHSNVREDNVRDISKLFEDVSKEYLTASDSRTAVQILNQCYKNQNFYASESNTWNTNTFIQTIEAYTGEFSVIAEEDKNRIRRAAQNLVKQYRKYTAYFSAAHENTVPNEYENDVLPLDEKLTLTYLDAYTELLKSVYICNVNEKSNPTAWILEEVFHFGYSYNAQNKTNTASKFTPFVVSALYMFVKNLEQYKKSEEFRKLKEPEQQHIFARILANNAVCRLRRYNIYVRNNEQTVELIKQGPVGTICCVQSPNESASIRDVRPVRIVEKIYMGFRDWNACGAKRDPNKFSVGVVSNIKGGSKGIKERIEEFAQSLRDCLRWVDLDGHAESIVVDWYCAPENAPTKYEYPIKDEKCNGKLVINLHNYSGSKLSDISINGGAELTRFISNNDLIFFIDTPILYRKHEFIKQSSPSYFKNDIFGEDTTYSIDYQKYSLDENLYNTGLINSLMTNISGQGVDNSAEYGKLVHRVNTMVTEHIRKMAEKSEKYKSIFMLLSSDTAISETDYDKRNIVRVERYNSKSFDVVNFVYGGARINWLCKANESTEADNTIVMTLYQLVKNIDRELVQDDLIKEYLYSNVNDDIASSTTIKRMRGIYIGLQYDTTPIYGTDTTIRYYIDKNEFDNDAEWILNNKQRIYSLIYKLVSIVYQPHPMPYREYLSLYTKYRVNFFTALFSSARTVSDMLYLHLLRDKVNIVHLKKHTEAEHFMPMLKDLKKYELHIDKKFYDDTMWLSDQTKNSFGVQSSIISNANALNISAGYVIKKLMEACKRFGYDGSYLYENMNEALGMAKDF